MCPSRRARSGLQPRQRAGDADPRACGSRRSPSRQFCTCAISAPASLGSRRTTCGEHAKISRGVGLRGEEPARIRAHGNHRVDKGHPAPHRAGDRKTRRPPPDRVTRTRALVLFARSVPAGLHRSVGDTIVSRLPFTPRRLPEFMRPNRYATFWLEDYRSMSYLTDLRAALPPPALL